MVDIEWSRLVGVLLEGVLGLVIAILLPKIPSFTKALVAKAENGAAKVNDERIRGILSRLMHLVGDKVIAAENTAIEVLKDKARDGFLSKEELKESLAQIKANVMADIKRDASATGLWATAVAVFLGNEDGLGKWLSDAIESHVAVLPPSGLQTPKAPGQAALVP